MTTSISRHTKDDENPAPMIAVQCGIVIDRLKFLGCLSRYIGETENDRYFNHSMVKLQDHRLSSGEEVGLYL